MLEAMSERTLKKKYIYQNVEDMFERMSKMCQKMLKNMLESQKMCQKVRIYGRKILKDMLERIRYVRKNFRKYMSGRI